MLARLFIVSAVATAAAAVVPQIKICDGANCPSVSRVGMGTLHLGDKISGLSDPGNFYYFLLKQSPFLNLNYLCQ